MRHPAAGSIVAPLASLLAPANIFVRTVEALGLAADQTPALKIANQANYANKRYTYNGEAAPKFYGYEGIGYGTSGEGFESTLAIHQFVPAICVMPAGAPTQKVTLVNGETGKPETAGAYENLQAKFEAVPVPLAWRMPSRRIDPLGTDRNVIIIQGSQMWEMERFEGSEGVYTFTYGGYIKDLYQWNGIWTPGAEGTIWGASASGLAEFAHMLTMQDICRVLRGGKIGHALGLTLPVVGGGFVAPATKQDGREVSNTPELNPKGEPNPAFGNVDRVMEGTWLRNPPSSSAAEFGMTDLLEAAIYEAGREYGFVVHDRAGNLQVWGEWAGSLGSPYCASQRNPFYGATVESGDYEYANAFTKPSEIDPSLPKITRKPSGTTSLLFNQPWQHTEVIEARAS